MLCTASCLPSGIGRLQGILPQSRHRFSVSSKSYFSETLVSPMQCFIARDVTLNSVISSLCYLVLSVRVFSIYYPKSIQGGGGTLGINFFPDTFMHGVTIFEDKPSIQWGLVSVCMLMEKCCATWPEVSSVPCLGNPFPCSAPCPSPALLVPSSTPADSCTGRLR